MQVEFMGEPGMSLRLIRQQDNTWKVSICLHESPQATIILTHKQLQNCLKIVSQYKEPSNAG